jgi:hypothetical protein
VIPILAKEECHQLIRWHNSHKHLETVGSNTDYQGIRKLHIQNEYIRSLFQKAENTCLGEIYKATGKPFYTEMSTMCSWWNGGYQDPHLDTYSNAELNTDSNIEQRVESGEEKPSREWTCILYLNDQYTGGETYFPPSDYYPMGHQVEKEVGDGLIFQGIYHAHGVFKVRRTERHTLALWFTEDLGKAMTQRPVSDLGFNETSIKNELQYSLDDTLFLKNDPTKDPRSWAEWKKISKNS